MTEPPTPPLPDSDIVFARPVHSAARAAVTPPELPALTTLARREALLDLWLVLLVTLFVPLGLQLVAAGWVSELDLDAHSAWLLTAEKWFDTLLAVGLLAYLALRHRLSPACFGLRRDRPLGQLLWSIGTVAIAYGWMMATVAGVAFLLEFFPSLEEDVLQRSEMLDRMPVDSLSWTVLLLIPVAIHEEIVFRGLLLPYLRRLVGTWWAAALLSSITFALLHFEQGGIGMLQVFGIGFVLATFFVRSRSLLAVIAAHFAFNFLQFQFIRWMT